MVAPQQLAAVLLCCGRLVGRCEGWADIAGALTLNGTHHVFQGCPTAGGWHHAASRDLVHFEDRGIHLRAIKESYEGMVSDSPPCSGFVTVDDEGTPCAGFRQCTSTSGITGLNPAAHPWDVPLELRCAQDARLTSWSAPEYLFPVYFYRALPFDPSRPFIDHDGNWYVTISTDGCNATTKTDPCAAGGQLDLWTSPALRGARARWRHLGSMFTSSHTALTHHGDHNVENKEFVTVDYIGSMPGDETGRVRVIVNNDASATGMGSTMYFIGLQANGSRFTDLRGGESFSEPGSTGMLDWGAFTTRNDTGSGWRRGLDALVGGQHRSVCMHRTLGSDPNQVAKSGRRVVIGWVTMSPGQNGWSAQSLPQDLSLGPDRRLRQAFVPELQVLRTGAGVQLDKTTRKLGQQLEVLASISPPPQGGRAGIQVLADQRKTATYVGVDFDLGVVYIDGTSQGSAAQRAGPLFDEARGAVHVHVIVDHSIVTAIFNNRTAVTATVLPATASCDGAKVFSSDLIAAPVVATAWPLATANPNAQRAPHVAPEATPPRPWQQPKIHNVPGCLRVKTDDPSNSNRKRNISNALELLRALPSLPVVHYSWPFCFEPYCDTGSIERIQ